MKPAYGTVAVAAAVAVAADLVVAFCPFSYLIGCHLVDTSSGFHQVGVHSLVVVPLAGSHNVELRID